MRLLALAVLLIPASPAVEEHAFTAKWQPHEMLFDEAFEHWTYTATWVIEVPAPTEKPSYVDIRAMSAYVYKHIAQNLGPKDNPIEFQDRTFLTSVMLEGVELVAASETLPDVGALLGPWEVFWGKDRPKVRRYVPIRGEAAGGFPEPLEDTWTLCIEARTFFDFESSGPTMFGQSLRQRIKGTVRYHL